MKSLCTLAMLFIAAIGFSQTSTLTVDQNATSPQSTVITNPTTGSMDIFVQQPPAQVPSAPTKKSSNPYENVTIKKMPSKIPQKDVKMAKPKSKGVVIDQ